MAKKYKLVGLGHGLCDDCNKPTSLKIFEDLDTNRLKGYCDECKPHKDLIQEG